MCETNEMIVPKRIEIVEQVDTPLNVGYRLVDGKVLERVIYSGTRAEVFRGLTDILLRTHFFSKQIINAFYHEFGSPLHLAPHLCIASEEELKLICLQTNECHSIVLPIKIQLILSTVHGLLLVRSENDETESSRGPSILYSLSHPYSELLPVVCRLKGEENKPFLFMRRKIQLVPSFMESNLVLGYDSEDNVNYLFLVRHCTDSEKKMARENLMESTTAGNNSQLDTLQHTNDSTLMIDTIKSEITSMHRSGTSFDGTPNNSQTNWKNRYRNTGLGTSQLRLHEHSQTETACTKLFANLSQHASHSQHLDCTKATSILTMITGEVEFEFDPNSVELTLECVWTDDLNRISSARSPSRLPIFTTLQISAPVVQRSNRSRTKLEKDIAGNFAKNLCITNKPTQTFTTIDLNGRSYFVFTIPGNKTVKVCSTDNFANDSATRISTVVANHAIPLLGTKYWVTAQNSPVLFTLYSGNRKISDLTIPCITMEPEIRVLSHIHQLICREDIEFEMVAELRSTTELSPMKEPVVKKPRRGVVSPKKRHFTAPDPFESVLSSIRHQSESQPIGRYDAYESPMPKSLGLYSQPSIPTSTVDFLLPPTSNDLQPKNRYLLKLQLHDGTTTLMGKHVHDTILGALPDRSRIEFEKVWLCKNTYRFVYNEYSQMTELEIALIFELLFESIGINPANFPWMGLVRKAKGFDDSLRGREDKIKREEDIEHPHLTEFLSQFDLNEDTMEVQQLEPQAAHREAFVLNDQAVVVFKALHELFDSLKRNKELCILRARRFMAEPLYILAGFYNIQKATQLYFELFPELSRLRVTQVKNQPRISFIEDNLSFDAVDYLCESFELDFITAKETFEPILTNTHRNKLRVLPTQFEIARWIKLRWPTDIRVNNINTMLDSSKPVLIPDLRVSSAMSDAQLRESQEKFLSNVALRTITRSFGSALLHFHSKQPESMEAAITEKICLHGKISPSNTNLEYVVADTPQVKTVHRLMIEWASFYNGVSRGLSTIVQFGDGRRFESSHQEAYPKELKRVEQAIATTANQSQRQLSVEVHSQINEQPLRRHTNYDDDGPNVVDWEWVFSKIKENKECSPALAGFILAAGLSGQSMSVNPFDLHEFLSLSDKMVVVSLLLGTSVAYRGTSNFYINKMIYAHLPFLLQPTLCDFRIEPVVQTVALLSLGCLFAKSMNQQLSNDLINQMSRETFFETDPFSERYAYVLAAGFSVGLINLGRGRDIELMERSSPCTHSRFHERLFILLNGDRRDLCVVNYQKDMCDIAQRGCCSCGMSRSDQKFQASQHQHHHRQRADCLTAAGSGGGGAAGAAGNPSAITSNVAAASSHVCELSTINIHLSSPAACIAFALVYMRTNLDHIAKKLIVPPQIYAIGLIRPDVLMLRTMAASLIMFDSISNTSNWIAKQIPPVLRIYAQRKLSSVTDKTDIDLPMRLRSYIYIRTGACFAMALKYTSTRNEQTTRILMQWFNELVEDFEKDNDWNSDSTARICSANTYVTCINVMMSALAIVNAGSGDITLSKNFRRIRNYNTQFTVTAKDSSLYSTHVIANMSLGLLFLGNGRYGLSSSNMSLAALLIAFFPVYGHAIYDNRCYFQGFRFLWTLAVEPRFLVTVAEGFQETIVAPMEIRFKDENTKPIVHKTPYLLPPLELISVIRIRAPDFQPIDLDLQKPENMRTLREILTNLSGRLPLKKRKRACGSHELRTLDAKIIIENDLDLVENYSDHSFSDDTTELTVL